MKPVDLNCDLGEGAGFDEALMPLISSANLACGGHAGDEASMHHTVRLAMLHRVAIGAHPGYDDREFFGRREKSLSPDDVQSLVIQQVEGLQRIAASSGARLTHVKPHGALYNQAARDSKLADAIARAVLACDQELVLFGPAGSHLITAGNRVGLRVVNEVFADRNYGADGALLSRQDPQARIEDGEVAAENILRILEEGILMTLDGTRVPMVADTVCVHGDGAHAVAILRHLRSALIQAGYEIKRVSG